MLPWIGMGLMAGSSVMKGFQVSRQKKNEAAVYKYNAAVKRQEAEVIKRRTRFTQSRQAERGARIMGNLKASIGGSGTVSTQGAPMLALAEQQDELELESELIGFQGRIEAGQAESAAGEFDMRRRMAKSQAKQAVLSGFLGAGAAVGQGMMMMPGKQIPGTPPGGGGGTTNYSPYSTASGGSYFESGQRWR